MSDLVYAFLGAIMLVGAPWFWVHCARPMLRVRAAGPLTTRLLLGVTAYTVVAEIVFVAATLTGRASPFIWWIAGVPWLVIVGLPYLDDYRFLIRLTRRR